MLQCAPLAKRFPSNPHVQKLVALAQEMGICFATSSVEMQWLFHPEHRTLYVWEPDLEGESLSYLVVVLAHELGHARDFDANPAHREAVRYLHWSETPPAIEMAAFVRGFLILKELQIPVSLEQYLQMIAAPMAQAVGTELNGRLCCLLGTQKAA